jgi:predicted DNA-binding protein
MLPQIEEQKAFKNPETVDTLVYLANKIRLDPAYKIDPEIIEKMASEVNDFLMELKVI